MSILKTVTEHRRTVDNSRGFTLLEVMLCVGIISFIIISLFSVQSGSISLANKNKFVQAGPQMAQKVLALISKDLEDLDQTQGDFGKDYPGLTWTCKLTSADFGDLEYLSNENSDRLIKIDIQIKDASGSNSFEMSTWRLAND